MPDLQGAMKCLVDSLDAWFGRRYEGSCRLFRRLIWKTLWKVLSIL